MVIIIGVMIFQIIQMRKMIQLIKVGLTRLNEKLKYEGIRVNLVFKHETCCEKY